MSTNKGKSPQPHTPHNDPSQPVKVAAAEAFAARTQTSDGGLQKIHPAGGNPEAGTTSNQ